MKTKNNTQKAFTKSLVVMISLILICVNVNAQSLWKTMFEDLSLYPTVLAMVNYTESSKASANANTMAKGDAMSALIEIEIEETLLLEDWMVNDKVFDVKPFRFEVETEENLELEGWMIKEDYFTVIKIDTLAENEESLELENWMINNISWEVR